MSVVHAGFCNISILYCYFIIINLTCYLSFFHMPARRRRGGVRRRPVRRVIKRAVKRAVKRQIQPKPRRRIRRRLARPRARDTGTQARYLANSQAVSAPNAISTTIRQSYAPKLAHHRISHSEFVADVYGTSSFGVTGYRLNPANSDLFPWLSLIASNYEEYRFASFKVHLRTQTSTQSVGAVIVVLDADPTDPLPLSKQSIMQYQGAVRSAPWQDASWVASPVELHRLSTYFIAQYPSTDAALMRQQDVGTLLIGTIGQASGAVISEMWIEYTVELIKPSMQSGLYIAYWQSSIINNPATYKAAITGVAPFSNFAVQEPRGAFTKPVPNIVLPGLPGGLSNTTNMGFLFNESGYYELISLLRLTFSTSAFNGKWPATWYKGSVGGAYTRVPTVVDFGLQTTQFTNSMAGTFHRSVVFAERGDVFAFGLSSAVDADNMFDAVPSTGADSQIFIFINQTVPVVSGLSSLLPIPPTPA